MRAGINSHMVESLIKSCLKVMNHQGWDLLRVNETLFSFGIKKLDEVFCTHYVYLLDSVISTAKRKNVISLVFFTS